MKNFLLFCFFLFITKASNAQTYVSGGIYANTTWTKAASPYIVTDTVVVFPGVTLTIEPGVTMKFEDTSRLEIREAKIIAIGTVTDSIIFTSNNPILKPGNWGGIEFNVGKLSDTAYFEFCSIKFADAGLANNGGSLNTISIQNSIIMYNFSGFRNYEASSLILNFCTISNNERSAIYCDFGRSYCYINNCVLKNNLNGIKIEKPFSENRSSIINSTIDSNDLGISGLFGLIENCTISNCRIGCIQGFSKLLNCKIMNNSELGVSLNDTAIGCIIKNNKVGIRVFNSFHIEYNEIFDNEIGIWVGVFSSNQISCNKICSNTNYDIQYEGDFTHNISFPNNYFCTLDSASTRPKIFDGYVDVKYGLVNFMPLDTSCYKSLSVKENKFSTQSATRLYPNPFSHTSTIAFDNPQKRSHQLLIFNSMGQRVMKLENIINNSVIIDRDGLQNGLYFYQLRNSEGIVGAGKMLIE